MGLLLAAAAVDLQSKSPRSSYSHPLISFSDPEFIPLTAAAADATPGKQPETVPAASKGERRMGTAATKRLRTRERGDRGEREEEGEGGGGLARNEVHDL